MVARESKRRRSVDPWIANWIADPAGRRNWESTLFDGLGRCGCNNRVALKGYLRSNECRELFKFKARAVEV